MSLSRSLRILRHSLQYPLAKLIVGFAVILPRRVNWYVSGILGAMASIVPGRSREVFTINRKHVMIPNKLDVRLRRVYRNLFSGVFDFLHLNSLSDERFERVVRVTGGENMSRALAGGRGVIAITAHYSSWELIPRAIALQGHGVAVVTRKIGRGRASEYFDEIRSRHGTKTIDRGSGFGRLMRVLRDNTAVGILIDQDTMGVESDFVDFLGLAARTPVGPARIALRFDIPILTLHISRGADGIYTVTVDEPMDLDGYRGENGHIELTADLTARIEEWIIEDPEQWIWIHERWARRPGWAPGLQ